MWGDIPNWVESVARALMISLRVKDPLTFDHCCRVGKTSRLLAKAMGLNEYEQRVAEFSGLFHDIGKIGISNDIICKPEKLTDEEYQEMKKHPLKSVEIISSVDHAFFKDLLPGVQHHHERVDGLGYPFNLKGDSIPLMARLNLVADTYDAMTENRSYRKGLSKEIVYKEIEELSGRQFDSQIGKIFIEAHPHWKREEGESEISIIEGLFKKVD